MLIMGMLEWTRKTWNEQEKIFEWTRTEYLNELERWNELEYADNWRENWEQDNSSTKISPKNRYLQFGMDLFISFS